MTTTNRRALVFLAALAALTTTACGGGTGHTGGESHWATGWLSGCVSDGECADGYTCLGHICSVTCTTNEACVAQGGVGECIEVEGTRLCGTSERAACDAAETACDANREGWFCFAGAATGCRRAIEVCQDGTWVPGALDACRDQAAIDPVSGAYEVRYGDAPVALDVLLVIDNSASMVGENDALAHAIPGFVAALNAQVEAAPRMAATSVDAQCEPNGTTVFASKGAFNTVPATSYPPPAQFQIRGSCMTDADCDALVCDAIDVCDDPPGTWACRAPFSADCLENPNGSVNASCRRHCQTDEECQSALGDPRYVCQKPSASPSDWGCLLPPMTDNCPSATPSFLDTSNLELVQCITAIGINQEKCLKFEEGFEASRLALDPKGPQAAQAAAFLRPEAILVVVYVSDEDDCSSGEALDEYTYASCGLLASTDEGGPLTPVAAYVEFLKNLKPAGRVMAMTVAGQSLRTDPAEIDADTAAYVASKGGDRMCYQETTLCTGSGGATAADWGQRYLELVTAFGEDGEAANICTIEQLSASFATLATKVARNAKRVCLPRVDTTGMTVTLVHDGQETPLVAGSGDGGYALVQGAAECSTQLALSPNRRVSPSDKILLRFATP